MKLMIFGLGYTATRIAAAVRALGGQVAATRRAAGADAFAFEDRDAVLGGLSSATHILSSVPPVDERDPVLDRYGDAIAASPAAWSGYLSSTGVYGDTGGAWVDETAPIGGGRRVARADADTAWGALRPDTRVFRLPGIYGPGRSALDRVTKGSARRVAVTHQVFSRVHVDDIVEGVLDSFAAGPPGAYNLADDCPASQNTIVEEACRLLGLPYPPLLDVEAAGLSRQARAFYSENRRVANGKAKRLLGWRPTYPDYGTGLRALSATISPAITSTPPHAPDQPQR